MESTLGGSKLDSAETSFHVPVRGSPAQSLAVVSMTSMIPIGLSVIRLRMIVVLTVLFGHAASFFFASWSVARIRRHLNVFTIRLQHSMQISQFAPKLRARIRIFWHTALFIARGFVSNSNNLRYAPGWPGIAPRWTSSAKTGVGTALNLHSRVWFTLSHGILNEIYFPRVDQACIRDFGFLVTDGREYFSEEKRNCTFENLPVEPGVPVYELRNTSTDGRYRIEKEVLTDPRHNV